MNALCVGVIMLLMAPAVAIAETTWEPLKDVTSAILAGNRATIVTSSTMTWPDGRQAVVTFWRDGPATYRCIDFFNNEATMFAAYCSGPSSLNVKIR